MDDGSPISSCMEDNEPLTAFLGLGCHAGANMFLDSEL